MFSIYCFVYFLFGGSRNKNCKFIHTYALSKNNKVTNVLGYIHFVYFSYVLFPHVYVYVVIYVRY